MKLKILSFLLLTAFLGCLSQYPSQGISLERYAENELITAKKHYIKFKDVKIDFEKYRECPRSCYFKRENLIVINIAGSKDIQKSMAVLAKSNGLRINLNNDVNYVRFQVWHELGHAYQKQEGLIFKSIEEEENFANWYATQNLNRIYG